MKEGRYGALGHAAPAASAPCSRGRSRGYFVCSPRADASVAASAADWACASSQRASSASRSPSPLG